MANWNGRGSRPVVATHVGRREIFGKTIAGLRHLAPLIPGLHPDAPWSAALEDELVVHAVGPDAHASDARWVRQALAHLLARGQQLGRWTHVGSVPVNRPKPPTDRLALVRRQDVEAAEARRLRFLEKLDTILTCNDHRVLKGALVVAAADFSAVLVEELLRQVPKLFDASASPVGVAGGLAWVELRYIRPRDTARKGDWKNFRRWVLDDISARIADKILRLDGTSGASAESCVSAFMCHVGMPPTALGELATSARAWWSLQLDEAMYQYATTMILAPSLPHHAFLAMVTGERRHNSLPRKEPRAAQAGDHEGVDDDDSMQDLAGDLNSPTRRHMDLELIPLGDKVFEPHRIGLCELKRVFSPFIAPGAPRPSRSRLIKRLEAWNQKHRWLGGWVVMMADWARAALDPTYLSGSAHGASHKSIHRYLTGFAKPFLSRLYHLPPAHLLAVSADESDDLDAFADGFDQLREQLSRRGGASTDREGLRQFLHFVRAVGGPQIYLGSDWRTVVSACDADANFLTEQEYHRVLEELSGRGPSGSYPVARARVMAILAYRLGLRWEELQTRRLDDLHIENGHATLWVRRNPYFKGKTRSSIRKIPLELFLTPAELDEIVRFRHDAIHLAESRPTKDMLFADPNALDRPPRPDMTHVWILDAMRNQSGDQSLVFHHLRHSAATQLYCRLFVDPPRHWRIHDWSLPSSRWYSDHPDTYASRVTCRTATDGARLFAVSNLLGHIDPQTTMRHYIHLADLALSAQVRHTLSIPPEVVARIDGIKRESVHRARSRYRRRNTVRSS